MIVIMNGGVSQIPPHKLTSLEKKMVRNMQRSRKTYWYPSVDALLFELKARTNIVDAANALYTSGVSFATFSESRCNEQYWHRTANGGFRINPGVKPSTAIRDIYQSGNLYAFECAGAIIIVMYKGVLETIGDAAFDRHFQNLYLYSWETDRDLRLNATYNPREANYGDALYFKNPDFNLSTPEWQGENVILLDDDLYYGHGIGIGSGQHIIAQLNQARRPGSTTSAYLDNLVLTPDFQSLSKLMYREGESLAR